jgi:hypothetical protein
VHGHQQNVFLLSQVKQFNAQQWSNFQVEWVPAFFSYAYRNVRLC